MQREKKQFVGFRLPPTQIEDLRRLSEAADVSVSGAVRSLIPSSDLTSLLLEEAALEKCSPLELLQSLVAESLKRRMVEQEPKLDPYFVANLTDPAEIVGDYRRLQDATRGNGEYRLEKPPAGGEWDKRGITGHIILARNEKLTPDGVEVLAS